MIRYLVKCFNYRLAQNQGNPQGISEGLDALSSPNYGPISTKLGTKNYWVEEIHICSDEGPRPFPREDISEIENYMKNILKSGPLSDVKEGNCTKL